MRERERGRGRGRKRGRVSKLNEKRERKGEEKRAMHIVVYISQFSAWVREPRRR